MAIGSTLAVVAQYFGIISHIKDDMLKSDRQLSERVTALETKMEPFWLMIQKMTGQILHSPHTPLRDKLLEKYANNNLSLHEAILLHTDLKEEFDSNPKKAGLPMALAIIRLDQIIKSQSGGC